MAANSLYAYRWACFRLAVCARGRRWACNELTCREAGSKLLACSKVRPAFVGGFPSDLTLWAVDAPPVNLIEIRPDVKLLVKSSRFWWSVCLEGVDLMISVDHFGGSVFMLVEDNGINRQPQKKGFFKPCGGR